MLPISIRSPPPEREQPSKALELDLKPYSSPTFSESQDTLSFPSAKPKPRLSPPLLFESILLGNVTITLILAVVYAHQLLHAQAQPNSRYPSANRAQAQAHNNALRWTILSTAITPVLSILAALTGHVLWCRQRRRRKGISAACSAIVAATFLVGWLVNVTSWAVCDWEPSSSGECVLRFRFDLFLLWVVEEEADLLALVCFQAGLVRDRQGKIVGVDPGLVRARVVLGSLVVVGYALCFAASIVRMRRRYVGGVLDGE